MTTKESIVYESLKLFSVNGYKAVSTRMIARSIQASDAVIYKHFKNKQEIFDCIVDECLKRYYKKISAFDIDKIDWKDLEDMCMDMFVFQTTDEWMTCFRQLLLIEQFKNEKMKEIYRKVFINGPIEYMSKLFKELIQLGYMKDGTAEVYAMDLYGPFFLYHTVGGDEEIIVKNLREHVRRFRERVVTDMGYIENISE